MENLLEYIARYPFNLSLIIIVTDAGNIQHQEKKKVNIIEKILKHCNLWTESKVRAAKGIVSTRDVDFILDIYL